MANIEVRGYVKRPETKTTSGGKVLYKFGLSEAIKDDKAPKGKRYEFYNVTSFEPIAGLEDGSYVTIKGYLKPRTTEVNGAKRTFLDVVAQQTEVAPPRGGQERKAAAPAAEPSDANEDWAF